MPKMNKEGIEKMTKGSKKHSTWKMITFSIAYITKEPMKGILTLRDNPNIGKPKQEELPLKSRVVLNIKE